MIDPGAGVGDFMIRRADPIRQLMAVPWTEWHKPVTGICVERCKAPHSIAIGLV